MDTSHENRLLRSFYRQDVLDLAPSLLGKSLYVVDSDGSLSEAIITETEAYRGGDDMACHASKGRTERTDIMFGDGGHVYMYLIYGMYWMLNVVSATAEIPQAVLIRGIGGTEGPGRLTRQLGLDASFKGEDLVTSNRIWIGGGGLNPEFRAAPRVGIDYAGEPWISMPWRFLMIL